MINSSILKLENFTAGYGDRVLIRPTTMDIPPSALTALIGRNGTGKSTLLRAIAGINDSYSGKVMIEGRQIKDLTAGERARTLAFVNTERPRIANLTARDVVGVGRAPYTDWIGRLSATDEKIVIDSLEQVGMGDYADRPLATMSDGECQRVMIARAFAQDTPVILLDEPTSFLDLPSRYELVALLNRLAHESGKTILFSTHELDIALRRADYVALLADRRLQLLKANEAATHDIVATTFGISFD